MTGGKTNNLDESVSREQTRAEMTDALAKFLPNDRAFASRITTKDLSLEVLRNAWVDKFRQLFLDMDDVANDKKIQTYIAKHFQFTEKRAEEMVENIIDTRCIETLENTLSKLYGVNPVDQSDQFKSAMEFFLMEPIGVIDAFFDRAHAYSLARQNSEVKSIAICDPHGSWLERQRSAISINKERSEISQSETDRLDEISAELENITMDSDSPEAQIISIGWEFPQIMDLRQTYERKIEKLAKTDQKNPTKLLKLFEKTTKEFRESEAERLTNQDKKIKTLQNIRDIQESIYDLLLEIFDLSNTDRNRLLSTLQKYTRLRQERDMILLLQRNREQFLQR